MSNGKAALVTGANKGIGKAIAKGLARKGFTVFLGARDLDEGEAAAVELKTEGDGRMFPVTDQSATVIDCLLGAASRAGVVLRTGSLVRNWKPGDRVRLRYSSGLRKVKEVLERKHVTGTDRAIWPVLEADGRVVWMKGVELEPAPGLTIAAVVTAPEASQAAPVTRPK